MPRANPDVNYEISIHALLAESDRSLLLPVRGSRISIHALLAESDHTAPKSRWSTGSFLSTLSLRRATVSISHQPRGTFVISIHALLAESDWNMYEYLIDKFISIHALLAESDVFSSGAKADSVTISIHALLAESDHHRRVNLLRFKHFYPRSPCGERRPSMTVLHCKTLFLSTLSLRRATAALRQVVSAELYFYPRSPCGERLVLWVLRKVPILGIFLSTLSLRRATLTDDVSTGGKIISIHALLAESDTALAVRLLYNLLFLSTLSLRRATHYDNYNLHCVEISIHALLAESDNDTSRKKKINPAFLSTLSLRRATRYRRTSESYKDRQFLSTLSLRRATSSGVGSCSICSSISIHALLAESDHGRPIVQLDISTFLSTLSLRRATRRASRQQPAGEISIHALLAESD